MYESTPQAIIDEESHPGVLHDMMNSSSSSSSDDSSTSDSSDSDTSGSGSIANAGKRFKRVFKNRRHRKSSASSVAGSAKNSALSSPSITGENDRGYLEARPTNEETRTGSALGSIVSGDEADADHEDNAQPRIRDFVTNNGSIAESGKSPERRKYRKKHQKKHHKRRHHPEEAKNEEKQDDAELSILGVPTVQSPLKEDETKQVGFADDVDVMGSPAPGFGTSKSSFNMRQLSSRANLPRPALPKMLSNNVFVNPAPQPTQPQRSTRAARSPQSSGGHLRRTNSLPDRLNRSISAAPSRSQPTSTSVVHSDPLPPFQHLGQGLRKVQSEDAELNGGEEKPIMSRTAAVVLLLCSTALVAVCAEFMVDAIPAMIKDSKTISQAFIGLIILPIVGNAAEHVTAVTVATKNKMDLAIGVAVGSSIQIVSFADVPNPITDQRHLLTSLSFHRLSSSPPSSSSSAGSSTPT